MQTLHNIYHSWLALSLWENFPDNLKPVHSTPLQNLYGSTEGCSAVNYITVKHDYQIVKEVEPT